MSKGRLEAFSDAVIAIVITIMVLELKAPEDADPSALAPLVPAALSYLLSFVYLGIYWNNHHHLFQAVRRVDGRVLWANMHLLFWLSLIPFATAWMGETHFATWPVATYGAVLLMAALAYLVLTKVLVARHGAGSTLAAAVGRDVKGKISIALYAVAIPATFLHRWIACGVYILVALVWLVPDRRIERVLSEAET
jgi:TMEM175 potassium channel family protein